MPKFLLTGLTQAISLELEPGFNTIGRNPTNDCRVRDATVSSFHCEIVLREDSVLVRDLGSTNGTFVQGRRVEESRLDPGWVLRLGSVELKLEKRDESGIPRVSVPEPTQEPAPAQVVLPGGYPACLNHAALHAVFRCTRCQKEFCPDCVRVLRLAGRKTRMFCPSCSGQCETLVVPAGVSTAPSEKAQTILGRLTQTIHMRLK